MHILSRDNTPCNFIKIRMACPGSAKLAQNDICAYTKVGRLSCQLLHPLTFAYIIESLKKLGCSKVISTTNDNFWMIFPSPYPNTVHYTHN